MNDFINHKLTGYSQRLRREMTDEENHLWYDFLKKLPVTVHRQKVIGKYIVDFYCASLKLVIEIDGAQHYKDENKKYDIERDSYFKSIGLTVKRYTNNDINKRFEYVCDDLYKIILVQSTPHPSAKG